MPANPWLYLLVFVVVILTAILVFSVLYSLLISIVAVKFSDKTTNKYTKEIEKMLPGKDCGACGCQSCWEYADAVLHTEKDEDLCPYVAPGTDEKMVACRERLQKIMEDPTPYNPRGPRFWERKFGGR